MMGSVTKKWLFLKVSSAILIPLMLWFAINLASIYDKGYDEVLIFISSQPSKFLFSLFLIFAYFFSALSISEVFEDYIEDDKIKNAANKSLNIFAIVFPLLIIILIFSVIFIGLCCIKRSQRDSQNRARIILMNKFKSEYFYWRSSIWHEGRT